MRQLLFKYYSTRTHAHLCSRRDEERERERGVPERELVVVPGNKLNVVIILHYNTTPWWWCGGFFLACEDFGENVRQFIPRLRFFSFFLLKWRLARAHLFHSLDQDQSTVDQRAETTVTVRSPMSCV